MRKKLDLGFHLGLRGKFETLPDEKVIFNLSGIPLSPLEKEALGLGLGYCFKPEKLNYTKFFLSFEKLLQQLSYNKIQKCIPDALNFVKSRLKDIALRNYYQFRPNISKHQQRLVSALKKLSMNKDLIITKPDKSRGVVLINRSEYTTKMNSILEDSSKFVEIQDDTYKTILKHEDRNNRLINQLHKLEIIDNDTRIKLRATGSRPGVMYGLPKLHKKGVPLRPILSSIGSPNYNSSKFLVPLLKCCINDEFMVKDSFEFCEDIANFRNDNFTMASFDISSLFTNIPVSETCNLILDKLFPGNDKKFCNFDRTSFQKLLDNSCKDNLFIFNEQLYKQIDGAPMGGCISPILANFFLSHYEKIWLNKCPPSFKPVYYKRFVDDTFLLFKDASHIDLFKKYINSQHKNIKFTVEKETNGQLPFLDVLVTKNFNNFSTDLYRKPTNTGLGLKFNSEVMSKYKFNLIHCLVDRAYKICSSNSSFWSEIEKLKSFFSKNGYPSHTIDKCITSKINTISKSQPIIQTAEKKPLFVVIPYMSNSSNKTMSREILEIVKRFYPQLELKILFKNDFSISSFFRFKDRVSTLLRSNLVYKYSCGQCNATYYGETTRHLKTRISEHKGLSPRTGLPLCNPSHSSIRDHALELNHDIDDKNFHIVFNSSPFDTKISESILIHKHNPSLNNRDSSVKLSILG